MKGYTQITTLGSTGLPERGAPNGYPTPSSTGYWLTSPETHTRVSNTEVDSAGLLVFIHLQVLTMVREEVAVNLGVDLNMDG